MGEFWQGLGTRAGSVWFATLLNNPDHRIHVVNEQISQGSSTHWMAALQRQIDNGFDSHNPPHRRYLEFVIDQTSQHRVFCDFNSFAPCFIPALNEHKHVDRIIGLIRHGVPQLWSLTNSYIWSRVTEKHWLVDRFLRMMWEFGGKKGKSFSQRTFWEKRCVQWSCMVYQYDTLKDWGFALDVHKLEDLTTNTGYLRKVIQTYDPRRVCSEEYLQWWQKNDLNRRIRGSRKPLAIWRRWSPEQQIGFTEMCGDGMRRYGYDIPRVGE